MIVTATEMRVLLGLTGSITDAEQALLEMVIAQAQAAVASALFYDPEYGTRIEILPAIGDVPGITESDEWRANATQAYEISRSAATNILQLTFLPVRSITDLREDASARHGTNTDAFATTARLTEGTNFTPEYDVYDADLRKVCRSGLLRRVGTSWPSEPGTVRIEYVSGYTAAEFNGVSGSAINARPLKDAILMTAVRAFRQFVALQKSSVTGFVAGVKVSESLGDYSYSLGALSDIAQPFTIDLAPEVRGKIQPFINYGACFA